MRLPRFGLAEQRDLFASSFAPHGDGFVFYRHAWAPGVPVTAEEREAYLRIPVGGSRRAFYKAIGGRPPVVPRRSWWSLQRLILAAMPVSFSLGLILLGMAFLARVPEHDPPLSWLFALAGALTLPYAAAALLVRLTRR